MYTTLNILKDVKACVGGYGRMVSFFGTGKDVKDQKIPLHVVALVGGKTDAEWALENGFINNKAEYESFYRRNLPAVFKYLFYQNVERRNRSRNKDIKPPQLKALYDRCFKVHTYEQVSALLEDLRQHNFSHDIYSEVLSHECWLSPSNFIKMCFEICQTVYEVKDCKSAFPEDIAAISAKKRGIVRASATTAVAEFDETGDEQDGDTVYGDDDDHDDSWEEREATRMQNGVDVLRPYWIRSTRKNRTIGQNIAFMLNEDPYSFMSTMKFKVPKGCALKPATAEKPATMEMTLTDPKSMFLLLRTVTAKSEIPDQDEE